MKDEPPFFSIVVPTRNRTHELKRALVSLQTQTFEHFEVLVVDDASDLITQTDMTVDSLKDPRFQLIRLADHFERAHATNVGLDAAYGDWLCLLDSDDEYATHYLETVAQAIGGYSEFKCFNFGAVVHGRIRDGFNVRYTGTRLRRTFKPAWIGDRHEEFRSGKIGSGSFVFHRSVWDVIEHFPEAKSPYKFHELATDVHHLYPMFIEKGGKKIPGASLGNPWG